MIIAQQFIAVRTARPDQVETYLYAHTKITARFDLEGDRTGFVLTTTVTDSENDHGRAERDAVWLAQYQADRLTSGMHGASVHPSARDAVRHLNEMGS